ncbi:MAG: NAD-dependent epimerase/dehydratase family protein [Bacteroidia bacterium]|nr:NAD-dependent epimerase/dehydratase family protein [Bacteroidia bacterium]
MKVLVTGGTGFLGEYIVRELLSFHYEVVLLVRNPSKCVFRDSPGVTIVEGDILDIVVLDEVINEVEWVIHAAAMVSFSPSDVEEMNRININGTENIVNLCLEAEVKKLVFVSSIAALGRTENQGMISENTRWVPYALNSKYAISKRKAELEVLRGKEEGLEVVILNPGVILGAGDWNRSSGQIFKLVYKGLRFYNRGVNGYVGVKDVARAIRLVLETPLENGERFVLVSENMSQKDLFTEIALSMNKRPPQWELPPFLAKMAGFVFELIGKITGKKTLISRETVRTSLHQHFYDGSKITRKLNFQYTPLKEVIRECGAIFLSQTNPKERE